MGKSHPRMTRVSEVSEVNLSPSLSKAARDEIFSEKYLSI